MSANLAAARRLLVGVLVALLLGAGAGAEGEWARVTFTEGSTLDMPGTPARTFQPASELGRSRETFKSRGPGGAYTALMTLRPPGRPSDPSAHAVLRSEAEFLAEDMGGRLVRLEEVASGPLRGWEIEFTRSRRGEIWYVRWMADGRRNLQLTLVAGEKKPARAEAKRFFESLAVAELRG